MQEQPLKGMDNPLLESNQVKAIAQAAKVVKWMEDVCPDMLSIAPLLGDIIFTGFKESRCAPVLDMAKFLIQSTRHWSATRFFEPGKHHVSHKGRNRQHISTHVLHPLDHFGGQRYSLCLVAFGKRIIHSPQRLLLHHTIGCSCPTPALAASGVALARLPVPDEGVS